jgi:hypothetical protein
MEHIPQQIELLLPEIRRRLVTELEDRYSTPGSWDNIDPHHIEMVRKREKIPEEKSTRELLIKIAQDFRLTPEETDDLEKVIFEF